MRTSLTYIVVFLGAGFGGALRHGTNVAAARLFGTGFPFGTLIVNVVGSLVMGLLAGWFAARSGPGQAWRLFMTTGILGGFTTFSTFSLDVAVLYERGQAGMAALYLVLSIAAGILGLFGGLLLIRSLA